VFRVLDPDDHLGRRRVQVEAEGVVGE
jgi:hypothetical protein